MQTRTTRCFRISDALVLVAATGLGLAGCRFWLSASERGLSDLWPTWPDPAIGAISSRSALWVAAVRAIPVSSILLLSWTAAVFLLRLRDPRPRRRLLWCQPGFLACVAAVFFFVWKIIGVGLLAAAEVLVESPARPTNIDYGDLAKELALMLFGYAFAPQANVGAAVLLVWLVTWASGRCRPEPSWVDRFGRVLGALWVCMSLLAATGLWLG
jgi:hypothetical protein